MKRMIIFFAVSIVLMAMANLATGQESHKDVTVLKVGLTTGLNHFTDRANFAQWGCTVPETMDVQGATITFARRPSQYWLSEEGDWGFEYGVTGTVGTSKYLSKTDLYLSAKPYLSLVMVPWNKVKYGFSVGIPVTMTASKATINGKRLGATPLSLEGGISAQYGRISLGAYMDIHEDVRFVATIDLGQNR